MRGLQFGEQSESRTPKWPTGSLVYVFYNYVSTKGLLHLLLTTFGRSRARASQVRPNKLCRLLTKVKSMFSVNKVGSSLLEKTVETSRADTVEYGDTASPVTLSEMFRQTALRCPDRVALCYKDGSDMWKYIKFNQYFELCLQVVKSFVKVIRLQCILIVINVM